LRVHPCVHLAQCKDNQAGAQAVKPAGWGVAVVEAVDPGPACLGGHEVAALYGPVVVDPASVWFLGAEGGTNNTGELCGVCEALLWLIHEEPSGRSACICYDSEYAANQAQGKWKANKNRALVERTQSLLHQARTTVRGVQQQREVRFLHVKGHSGHMWNDRADGLANMGAAGGQCSVGRWAQGGVAMPQDAPPASQQLSKRNANHLTAATACSDASGSEHGDKRSRIEHDAYACAAGPAAASGGGSSSTAQPSHAQPSHAQPDSAQTQLTLMDKAGQLARELNLPPGSDLPTIAQAACEMLGEPMQGRSLLQLVDACFAKLFATG
jgi:ribonuclease HI